MRIINYLSVLLAMLCVPLIPAAAAEKDVGIVLMHGKWDRPASLQVLARQLGAEGFQVVTPTMPWAANRDYDVSYPKALVEIESAANSLREKGARRIVIGGLSFGGNGALAYAASGKPMDAIFVLSPGHRPDFGRFRTTVEPSVAKASQMIRSGAANERSSFLDTALGESKQIRTSAESYFSYFDPDGLGAMPKTAAAIPSPIPIFMAVGSADPISSTAETSIYSRAPRHGKSTYITVSSDHLGVATVIGPTLIAWLKSLE